MFSKYLKSNQNILLHILIFLLLSQFSTYSQIVSQYVPTTIDVDYHFGSLSTNFADIDLDKALVKNAETRLLDILKNYPDAATSDLNVFLKAKVDLLNGNFHIAIKELELFIEKRNNSPFVSSAYLFSGYIMFEYGNFEEAEKYFEYSIHHSKFDKDIRPDNTFYEDIEHTAMY